MTFWFFGLQNKVFQLCLTVCPLLVLSPILLTDYKGLSLSPLKRDYLRLSRTHSFQITQETTLVQEKNKQKTQILAIIGTKKSLGAILSRQLL